jgi:hypothetical protein
MFRPWVRVLRIVDTSRVPAHYAVHPVRRRSGDGWSGSSDTWGPYFKGVRPSGRRATPSVSTSSYRTSPENGSGSELIGPDTSEVLVRRSLVRLLDAGLAWTLVRRHGFINHDRSEVSPERRGDDGLDPWSASRDRRCFNCPDRGPFREDHRSAVRRRKGRLANETGWLCLRELESGEDAGGSPRLGVAHVDAHVAQVCISGVVGQVPDAKVPAGRVPLEGELVPGTERIAVTMTCPYGRGLSLALSWPRTKGFTLGRAILRAEALLRPRELPLFGGLPPPRIFVTEVLLGFTSAGLPEHRVTILVDGEC